MSVKALLKKTSVYDLYKWWKYQKKYFRYDTRLRKEGITRDFPNASGIQEKAVFGDKRLIVSLTSFPERCPYVGKTICSIMHQSLKPNMIVLWLSKDQFPQLEDNLPSELLQLTGYGLTIRWLDGDIRSYKKLIPALKEYPEDVIVTTDDDVYYPHTWLESLVKSYNSAPHAVHAHVATRVDYDGNEFIFTPRYETPSDGSLTYHNSLVGFGGVLYPPHVLHTDAVREDLFMTLAPTNDDIWFWAMAMVNGNKVCWVKDNAYIRYYVEGSQEETPCLKTMNNHGENLKQIQTKSVFEAYNLYDNLLRTAQH